MRGWVIALFVLAVINRRIVRLTRKRCESYEETNQNKALRVLARNKKNGGMMRKKSEAREEEIRRIVTRPRDQGK